MQTQLKGDESSDFTHHLDPSGSGDYAATISEKYNEILDMRIETLPSYRGADNQAFVDYGYDDVWIAHPDATLGDIQPMIRRTTLIDHTIQMQRNSCLQSLQKSLKNQLIYKSFNVNQTKDIHIFSKKHSFESDFGNDYFIG